MATRFWNGASDGYLTLNASGSTPPKVTSHARQLSVHVVVDNTDAAGKITFEQSNDAANWVQMYYKEDDESVDGYMVDGYDVTSGNNVNIIVSPIRVAKFLRVTYTRTSGTGGLQANIFCQR